MLAVCHSYYKISIWIHYWVCAGTADCLVSDLSDGRSKSTVATWCSGIEIRLFHKWTVANLEKKTPRPPSRLSNHHDPCTAGLPTEQASWLRQWPCMCSGLTGMGLYEASNQYFRSIFLPAHNRFLTNSVQKRDRRLLWSTEVECYLNTGLCSLPVGTGCSRSRSPWGRRLRRHGTAELCLKAGHCWVGNKPPESSPSGPVILQLWLSGGRQITRHEKLQCGVSTYRTNVSHPKHQYLSLSGENKSESNPIRMVWKREVQSYLSSTQNLNYIGRRHYF